MSNYNIDNENIVKKIQKVVFSILCDIDDFCKENNLKYYLSGGTCLGAVRHKGFIPWDDDGDIMMPREDFEKFLEGFSKKYKNKYAVGSIKTDNTWQRPSAQIYDLNSKIIQPNLNYKPRGISVDVFAIDGVPENSIHRWYYYKKLRVLNGIRNTSIRVNFRDQEKNRIVKKIVSLFTRKIGPRYFAVIMDKYASRFAFESSRYVAASLPIHYGARETIEKQYMMNATLLDFEGRKFPVPIGYDKYLTNLYGNYMEIPEDAKEKGYTHLDGWQVELNVNNADEVSYDDKTKSC